jgi:integrase
MGATIAQAFGAYEEHCIARKQPRTRQTERFYLESFRVFLIQEGVIRTSDISLFLIEKYKSSMLEKWSASSLNRSLNVIKHMIGKWAEWNLISDFSHKIKKEPEEPTLRLVWTKEELNLVRSKLSPMLSAFLLFIWLTGIRPGQVCEIRKGDVDISARSLRTQSKKGGKLRRQQIPLSDDALNVLLGRMCEPSPWIFPSPRGAGPLTVNVYAKAIRRIVNENQMRPLSAYGLRHAFGTRLASKDVALTKIAKLMGHSRTTTTERYIHTSEDELREALRKIKD